MERDQSELSEMGSACLFTVAMVTRFIKTGRVTRFWKLDGSVDRVPTRTGKPGKPGKMGRHFPVREKSGNFEQTGKVREKSGKITQNTGKLR